MSTKKQFVELLQFLEQNSDKKVNTILDKVREMTMSQKRSETVLYADEEKSEVVAIFCYYHKRWELLSEVEYGAKKHSASGYNTMCKEGVNAWTKQQSEAKKAKAELLDAVANGEVDPKDLKPRLEQIEIDRLKVVPRTDGHGTEEQPQLS